MAWKRRLKPVQVPPEPLACPHAGMPGIVLDFEGMRIFRCMACVITLSEKLNQFRRELGDPLAPPLMSREDASDAVDAALAVLRGHHAAE